jgi:hypothetical protein
MPVLTRGNLNHSNPIISQYTALYGAVDSEILYRIVNT